MFKFSDVEPYLISAISQILRDNTELFDNCKQQTIEIIRRYVPLDDNFNIPKKFLLPAAWIISYIYVNTASSIESTELSRYNSIYNEAIKLLQKDRNKPKLGNIEGVWI